MDSQHYTHVEQDYNIPGDGNKLPTYEQLAEQGGPNSRFGRWRSWIEKRAAERYNDITPEERKRRRQRGWGNDIMNDYQQPNDPMDMQPIAEAIDDYYSPPRSASPPLPPLPSTSQRLGATHLKMHQFGSRFLPHTTSQIRCLLPLMSDRLLLIGHDEGLSVLDMYPQHDTDSGIVFKGPDEAHAKPVWQGESVFQMSLLEVEDTGEGTPQGVVLLLVGPEPRSPPPKENESQRMLRMYSLASLTSLAKFIVSQKGARPVDLSRPSQWNVQQTPTKKHRHHSSLARGLKNLIDSPNNGHSGQDFASQYSAYLSSSPSPGHSASPSRQNSDDSSWDMIEDLPLRWATDFVPLASPGSRLLNQSVISYAIWNGQVQGGIRGRLLAVATKSNILLYETPKGERAFRFVKEFYTPLHPRSITFFQQSVSDLVRSPTDVTTPSSRYHSYHHKRSESTTALRDPPPSMISYGTQISLFVIFDKKAGWIRLADSAVGEIEMYADGVSLGSHLRDSSYGSVGSRKSRSFMVESATAAKWIPPVQVDLVIPSANGRGSTTKPVHLLTRGKQTHMLPCPLPSVITTPPLRIITWKNTPSHVEARVTDLVIDSQRNIVSPFLQLTSFGAHGIEVQEIPIAVLSKGKGKGKALPEEPIWAEEDIGGDTGFLCPGGHWNNSYFSNHDLSRTFSTSSTMSSMSMEEQKADFSKEEGLYAWCRKGPEDWRVFWLGYSSSDAPVEGD